MSVAWVLLSWWKTDFLIWRFYKIGSKDSSNSKPAPLSQTCAQFRLYSAEDYMRLEIFSRILPQVLFLSGCIVLPDGSLHRPMKIEQFSNVLFTGESRSALHLPDGRHRMWGHSGELLYPLQHFSEGPFWRRFSDGVTAERYVEDVLQKYVVPFIGDTFLCINDYARLYLTMSDYILQRPSTCFSKKW